MSTRERLSRAAKTKVHSFAIDVEEEDSPIELVEEDITPESGDEEEDAEEEDSADEDEEDLADEDEEEESKPKRSKANMSRPKKPRAKKSKAKKSKAVAAGAGKKRRGRHPNQSGLALKALKQSYDKTGLTTKDAIAAGYEDLEERDRGLCALIPAEIESSEHLTAVHSFKAAADKLDWAKTATAPHNMFPEDIDNILRQPAVRNLEFTIRKEKVSTRIQIFDAGSKKSGKPVDSVISKEFTHDEIEAAASTYTKLLERYPGSIKKPKLSSHLLTMAVYYAIPTRTYVVRRLQDPEVWMDGDKKTYRYICDLHPVLVNGVKYQVAVRVDPRYIDSTKAIPPLPPGTMFQRGQGTVVQATCPVAVPKELSDAEVPVHNRAILFLSWLSLKVSISIFENKGAVGGYINFFTEKYLGRRTKSRRMTGTYDGLALYQLKPWTSGNTIIRLTRGAIRDMLGGIPAKGNEKILNDAHSSLDIMVHAQAWALVGPVVDALDTAWLSQKGLYNSMLTAAATADTVNAAIAEGMPTRVIAQRDEATSTETGMTCEDCGTYTFWDKISLHASSQVYCCVDCMLSRTMLKDLIFYLWREQKLDTASARPKAQSILDSLAAGQGAGDDVFRDYYNPTYVRGYDGHKSENGSLESKFPIFRNKAGEIGYHIEENVVICALWENLGKNASLPGMMALNVGMAKIKREVAKIKQALATDEAQENAEAYTKQLDDFAKELEHLEAQEEALFEISLKTPYALKHRAASISTKALTTREYEMRSGKMLSVSKPAIIAAKTKYVNIRYDAPRPNWRPCATQEDFEHRLKPLINEILDARPVEANYGTIDDCPFPGPAKAVPEDWCWWRAWIFVGERLMRMWLWCNEYWLLVDTTETIFLTWLYCWVNGDRGLTGLDWVLWSRHIRRIAFGKAVHGRQMRGYFPRKSASLADLNIKDSNMQIETAFGNYAVGQWDERFEEIQKQFFEIVVPSEDWNPDLPAPATSATSVDMSSIDGNGEVGDVIAPGGQVAFDDEAENEDEPGEEGA